MSLKGEELASMVVLLPATVTLAVWLTIAPMLSSVARHWYEPSSGRWWRECSTFCTKSDPFDSCCLRSSTTALSSTPSFFQAMTGTPWSERASQSSCSTPPRTVTASCGSSTNRSSTKARRGSAPADPWKERVLQKISDRPILIFYNRYRYRLFVCLCTR